MGASRREPGRRANETLRQVELTRPFYLGIMEVSNEEFRVFDKKHLSGAVGSANLEIDHHPVVRVTWEEAALYYQGVRALYYHDIAYCHWTYEEHNNWWC